MACEFSGIVRDAFAARGHDAWSCDLLPSERPGNHLQCDVLTILDREWDLLIAHPPCTYLCNSGVRWLTPKGSIDKQRQMKMMNAADLFGCLYHAACFKQIPHIAIENPVMHGYARDYLQSVWKVPTFTQSIQPWQFGHGEVKRTCLWLRGLPPLQPTEIVSGRIARVHRASPGPDRWKERSRTLEGVAKAMAEQWSNL